MGIVNRTVYDSTAQAASHEISFPPAGAGNRLVLIVDGPANLSLAAADLDAGWVVRAATPINFGELLLADLPAAGGETSVTVELNGARVINAVVYERDDLDALADAAGLRTPGSTQTPTSAAVTTGEAAHLALFGFGVFFTDLAQAAADWTGGVVEDYDATVDPASNESSWLAAGWAAYTAAGAKTTSVTLATPTHVADGIYSVAAAWARAAPPAPPGGGGVAGRHRLARPFQFERRFERRWGT